MRLGRLFSESELRWESSSRPEIAAGVKVMRSGTRNQNSEPQQ